PSLKLPRTTTATGTTQISAIAARHSQPNRRRILSLRVWETRFEPANGLAPPPVTSVMCWAESVASVPCALALVIAAEFGAHEHGTVEDMALRARSFGGARRLVL